MTSPSPLLYDTYYHIYNRGNNRENIFIEERNYEYFMGLYAKYIEPVAETFAYCLLRNHFHVLVRVKSVDEILMTLKVLETFRVSGKEGKPLGSDYPSKRFSNFFNAYAKAINKAYNRTGSLFQHPFGRVPVASEGQFFNAVRYIHQNPQKHKFVEDFREWKWSSYETILADKPTRLSRDAVLDWFGNRQEYLTLHGEWVEDAKMRWFVEDDDD
jgi:REP element-mobilizing transposase RayT